MASFVILYAKNIPRVCQQIKYAIRSEHKLCLGKTEASFKSNPKSFWKYHKSILNRRSALNPVITFKDVSAKSPKEKAELFNYFCSVFRPTKSIIYSDASTSSMLTPTQLSNITVSEEVLHHLLSLDPSKASGLERM